jgi:hypothetical protein
LPMDPSSNGTSSDARGFEASHELLGRRFFLRHGTISTPQSPPEQNSAPTLKPSPIQSIANGPALAEFTGVNFRLGESTRSGERAARRPFVTV